MIIRVHEVVALHKWSSRPLFFFIVHKTKIKLMHLGDTSQSACSEQNIIIWDKITRKITSLEYSSSIVGLSFMCLYKVPTIMHSLPPSNPSTVQTTRHHIATMNHTALWNVNPVVLVKMMRLLLIELHESFSTVYKILGKFLQVSLKRPTIQLK